MFFWFRNQLGTGEGVGGGGVEGEFGNNNFSKQRQIELKLCPYVVLTLDLFLSATPKGWKKSIGFPDPGLYAESFAKKNY